MAKKVRVLPFIVFAYALLPACGSSDNFRLNEQGYDASHEQHDFVIPPQEYYEHQFFESLKLLDTPQESKRPILYLNFNGGTITKGYGRGQSFILCKSQATIPSANVDATTVEYVVNKVQDFYVKAGSALKVTTTKPSSGNYTTMMIGGTYNTLGCLGGSNILGVAPLDSGNTNPNDIGFVFQAKISSAKVLAETIAHEAGHTYGLDHVREQKGLMYPSITSKIEGFIRGTIGLGRIQDEPAILQKLLGKITDHTDDEGSDKEDLDPIVIPTPDDDEKISDETDIINPSGIRGILAGLLKLFKGFNSSKTHTYSLINMSDINSLFPDIASLDSLSKIGDLGKLDIVTMVFDMLKGSDSLSILDTFTGLSGLDISEILKFIGSDGSFDPSAIIAQMLLKFTSGSSTDFTSLDLSKILGIDMIDSLPDLISLLNTSGCYVDENASGETREAMMSMLKLGYLQAYERNIKGK